MMITRTAISIADSRLSTDSMHAIPTHLTCLQGKRMGEEGKRGGKIRMEGIRGDGRKGARGRAGGGGRGREMRHYNRPQFYLTCSRVVAEAAR